MQVESSLLPCAIADIMAEVAITGKITLADRYALMAAVMDESINPEERAAINRLLRATCRGRFQVVDEFSTTLEA